MSRPVVRMAVVGRRHPLLALAAIAPLVAAAANAPSAASASPGLEEVIARHVEAVGGAAALEATRDLRAVLRWDEPGLQAEVTATYTRAGRVRVDARLAAGRGVTEAHDGTEGWSRRPAGEVVAQSAEGAAAMRRAVELPGWIFGLHELPARGHRLRLGEPQIVDGRRHEVVEVTLDDGFRTDLLFDAETWLLTRRRERRSLHPDIDPTEHTIENRFGDFRRDGGVLRPYSSETVDLDTGTRLMGITVISISVNAGVEDAFFARPRGSGGGP